MKFPQKIWNVCQTFLQAGKAISSVIYLPAACTSRNVLYNHICTWLKIASVSELHSCKEKIDLGLHLQKVGLTFVWPIVTSKMLTSFNDWRCVELTSCFCTGSQFRETATGSEPTVGESTKTAHFTIVNHLNFD